MQLLRDFYTGKTVLVTGHTGFKGSWLVELLHTLGARVVGYALPPEGEPPLFEVLQLSGRCDPHVIGDVSNLPLLREVVADTRPDVVFHLAAQSLVRRSYREPVGTWAVNTLGTVHLLEALRSLTKRCAAVVITTDKVYENPETGTAFAESDPLGGYDPYSASKAAAELVVASYRRSFYTPVGAEPTLCVASARSGNVIGGGDTTEDRIVPDFFRALATGQPLYLRSPTASRPWQHVLEPLVGYLQLAAGLYATPERYSKAYNFGPDTRQEATVEHLVQAAIAQWGSGSYQSEPEPQGPHEAQRLQLDSSLAQRELGWQAHYDWQTALGLTLAWHRASDKPATTQAQIADYLALLG